MEKGFRNLKKRDAWRITRYVFFVLASAAFTSTGSTASAQQSSFIVTPTPAVSPAFVKDQVDLKVRGTILFIKNPDSASTDLTGVGGDMIFRKAFSDLFAGDVQGGLLFVGGDMMTSSAGTTVKTTFLNENILLSANGEFQPYRGETVNFILFGGPLVNLLFGNIDINTTTGGITSTSHKTMSGALAGVQAGVQAGIKAGDFRIDPFAAVSSQSGSITISSSYGEVTSGIDAFTTTSFGLDFVYTPWDFTVSSILQKVAEQKSKGISFNPGYDVAIIQFGWHKQF